MKNTQTDSTNKEIFTRNLKRYLNLHEKTQKEVAAAIGVTTGNFCDWVKGRSYPRIEKLQALADYFGVTMASLVEDVNMEKETISDEDQAVLDLFHEVPEEKRELVLSMIRAAVGKL